MPGMVIGSSLSFVGEGEIGASDAASEEITLDKWAQPFPGPVMEKAQIISYGQVRCVS